MSGAGRMRKLLGKQIRRAKRRMLGNAEIVWSDSDGRYITRDEASIDHWPVPLCQIKDAFLSAHQVGVEDVRQDTALMMQWRAYHKEHASYRVMSTRLNNRLGVDMNTRIQCGEAA